MINPPYFNGGVSARTPDPSHAQSSQPVSPSAAELPRLAYTMQETADILGISYISVHRLCKRGLLKSSTALRTKLIPKTEIERFLKSTLK